MCANRPKISLPQLRSTDPAATLAGAQSELAQEYGFPAWADLKAEVDRLRATTRVANAGTAGQLAEAFGLGTVTGPMTAIDKSWAGEVWSLHSDRGRWAATQLFQWTPVIDNHLDDEVRLVEAARSAGLAAPLPVRSTDGRVLGHPELGARRPYPTPPGPGRLPGRMRQGRRPGRTACFSGRLSELWHRGTNARYDHVHHRHLGHAQLDSHSH